LIPDLFRQELKFKENFTLLEDERATKKILNLESTKGGYNEITTLREICSQFDTKREEGLDNINYNVYHFQEFYKVQPSLKTSRDDLLKFLNSDKDSSPFAEFNSRKIPAYMARKMEGKLTKAELEDALSNKMHGNRAPGLDGFTVNWLRTFC
jgi:hypothetical protein